MKFGLKGIFKPLAVLGAVVLCLSLALAAAPVPVAADGGGQTLNVAKWTVPAATGVSGRETVLKVGETYHMWYSPSDNEIRHTSSTTPGGFAAATVACTFTGGTPAEVGSVTVYYEDGTFYMIAYEKSDGTDPTKKFAIYTSSDGDAWAYAGLVFGGASLTDYNKIDGPYLFKDGTKYRLYFQVKTPETSPTRYDIYTAESTAASLAAIADGNADADFTLVNSGNPVLSPSTTPADAWDSGSVMQPWVVKDGNVYYMWYSAHKGTNPQLIGFAYSSDGYNWTKSRGNPIMTGTTGYAEPSVIVNADGIWQMWCMGTGGTINYLTATGPFEFSTIQSAIDKADSGDTINVAAGEYEGFSVVSKTNLTIIGAGSDQTFVAPTLLITTNKAHKYTPNMLASVFVDGSAGILLQDMTIKSTSATPGSGGADAIVFWNASSGTISNCAIEGMYTISGAQTGQGLAVDGGTTVLNLSNTDISGFQKNAIDVVDGNAGTTPGDITVNVSGGIITGAGPTSVIAQNGIMFWNRGGGNLSGAISGVEITGFNYIPDGDGDEACGFLNYGCGAGTLSITGCNFHDNEIHVYDNQGSGSVSVHFNNFHNIVGDQGYGVYNGSTTVTLDATNNWWGTAVGSEIAAMVFGNVDYDPWIGAPTDPEETVAQQVSISTAGGTATVYGPPSSAIGEITVTAGTSGAPVAATLVAATYEDNPGGTHSLQAQGYYDVHLSNAAGVSSVTIEFAGLPNTVIYYWDETEGEWLPCDLQSYSGGVVTVTITSSTHPNLTDLAGLPLLSATTPPIGGDAFPISPWAANAPWIALGVALAAGAGVFAWRRARV